MKNRWPLFQVWFVVLLIAALLAGCSNPLDRLLPAADDGARGSLTIYTTLDENQANTYLRLFRAAHSRVDVELISMPAEQLLSRLVSEKDEPQADVVWGAPATIMALLEWQDVLLPYAPEGLNRIYLQFRDSSNPPYWVGFGAWMSVFCVNSEELESLGLPKPDSWKSLRDPIYAGQIAMASPDQSRTGYMIVEALLEFEGEIQGWENLSALDSNIKTYTRNSDEACEMAANGDIAIGIAYDLAPINLAAEGKPVEAVFASEGAGWEIEANGLIRQEEVKEVAQHFLDWAISDQAMTAYGASRVLLSTPLEGHSPPPGFPEQPLTLLYDKDFAWASANRERIIAEWLVRYGARVNTE